MLSSRDGLYILLIVALSIVTMTHTTVALASANKEIFRRTSSIIQPRLNTLIHRGWFCGSKNQKKQAPTLLRMSNSMVPPKEKQQDQQESGGDKLRARAKVNSDSSSTVLVSGDSTQLHSGPRKDRVYKFSDSVSFFQEKASQRASIPGSTAWNLPIEGVEGLTKQPMLYIPGLDGTGNFSAQSFANLTLYFDCWRMYVTPQDRSSFLKLADAVIQHIEQRFDEPPILIGESFGGLLATYVASRLGAKIAKLVLINPATSYDRTTWPTLGPIVASTPRRLYPLVGASTLLATAVQPQQITGLGRQIVGRIRSANDAQKELTNLWQGLQSLPDSLPSQTLQWRLKNWLGVGACLVNSQLNGRMTRYARVTAPVLVVVGQRDRLLPSAREGRRLKSLFTGAPRVEVRVFPDRGHAILDGTLDLAEVITESRIYRIAEYKRRNGGDRNLNGFNDYYAPMPSSAELQAIAVPMKRYYEAVGPVFLSRDPVTGRLQRGLQHVPTGRQGRPVLLVGNHQLLGLDLPLLVSQFLEEKDTLIRGLTHPFIFQDQIGQPTPQQTASGDNEGVGETETSTETRAAPRAGGAGGGVDRSALARSNAATRELFTTFGAVKVSPMSIYQLMRMNETILLFPGGIREAAHKKDEAYKLFWPNRTDFVRMAAMMDALIVPFAAVGVADSLNYLLDGDDLQRIPSFLNGGGVGVGAGTDGSNTSLGSSSRLDRFRAAIPQARPDVPEDWNFPLVAPGLPDRAYLLFQQPYDTRGLNPRNKTACRTAYEEVQGSVQAAIDTALELRKHDPYRGFLKRIAYERINGQEAPTASLAGF